MDEHLDAEPDRWVQSACVLCSNDCALDIGVKDDRIVGVRGRGVDRTNRGRLGPKGLHGWRANHSPDRLTTPLIRSGGHLRELDFEVVVFDRGQAERAGLLRATTREAGLSLGDRACLALAQQ